MKKMTGMLLMILGVLTFGAGMYLYKSADKATQSAVNSPELVRAIEMAKADGVLTPNEREIIRQLAVEQGLDAEEILAEVEQEIAEIESETEMIDVNKKNGDDFEKFVVQKFDSQYFRIKEWAGDKYVNGLYADNTLHPDLLLEFRLRDVKSPFAIECKWKKKTLENGVLIARREQLERYKDFEKQRQVPVFVALGIGGSGKAPEALYIIPLREIEGPFISTFKLQKYRRKVDRPFYFDYKEKELR